LFNFGQITANSDHSKHGQTSDTDHYTQSKGNSLRFILTVFVQGAAKQKFQQILVWVLRKTGKSVPLAQILVMLDDGAMPNS
jgi:hypothetical protein